jgi:DNA-binding XRE family transcriptional regulator
MKPGEKLGKARRAQAGKLSQYDVAKMLGIKRPTYHAWESGQNQPPTAILKRLGMQWGMKIVPTTSMTIPLIACPL